MQFYCVHIRKTVELNTFIRLKSMDFPCLGMQICIVWSQMPFKKTWKWHGSENQSVSGVTTIYLMQLCTSTRIELIRLLIVACGMLSHSSSMTARIAGYLRDLEHAVVHIDPEHPKHAQWMTCLVSMQALEEIGHFQLAGIVFRSLRHGGG